MLRVLTSLWLLISCTWVYAEQGDRLVVANSKAWKPYAFINHKGEPDGILIDYWREYGRVHNLDVEFLLVDWQESLDAVKEGRADVHAGLLWSESRESYLDFSPELLTIDAQIYVNQSLIGTNLDEFMLGDQKHRVGVVTGGFEEEFTRLHFPNLNLVSYPNNQSMIEAAYDGKLQAFVADLQVANFYLYSSEEPHRFVGARHLYSGELRAAVREGNLALQQQISDGINAFDSEAKKKIFSRWMYVSTVYPDFLLPVVLLIIGVATTGYIVLLNQTVKRRTQALQQANLELKKLSETDPLTQLSNRRHFFAEFQQRLKAGGEVTIMVFDIDDFKQVNDSYGHQIGDEVIERVAHVAQQALSDKHLMGRVGGEEFAVVLSDQSFNRSIEIAEAICSAIRNIDFECLNKEPNRVTVSLGCAYYAHADLTQSLNDADHLMYQSKMEGKNRVSAKAFV